MKLLVLGFLGAHLAVSASTFSLLECTNFVAGTASARAAIPVYSNSYNLQDQDPVLGHASIGGGLNQPSAKVASYASQQEVWVQQYPTNSGPDPYDVNTYARAETDLVFQPDFVGTGDDIIFSFLRGQAWTGGFATITDLDTGVVLFNEQWGYDAIRGDGQFTFHYDSWNPNSQYLLNMNVSAQEYERDINISMSNNMAFSTPVSEFCSTSFLASIGLSILLAFKKRLKSS